MKHNYHIHTYRCHHASGTEEEYIKKAIAEGMTTLGFADHTPYPYPGGYVSRVKMGMEEMDGYFSTLLALREKYRGTIDIKIGFEAEHYPLFFDALLAEYRRYPLDYLILALHHVGNESVDGFNSFEKTDDAERVKKYVDAGIAAMQTGRFSIFAHPDVLYYVGDTDVYRSEMSRLILEAKRLSIPLELNMLGIRNSRHYPNPIFWEEAARLGATAVFGLDSHRPEDVLDRNNYERSLRFADRFGINVIDEVKLINPLF